MWEFTHTETTAATPAQLWSRYTDCGSWPEWDVETESVTLDGPFATGTTGTIKPVGAPKAKFRMAEVTKDVSFSDVTKLPLAKMHFTHNIESADDGTRFTHHVTITGPLSPLFGRVIGKKVAAGLPTAMRRLGELAEREPC
jgi:hypothetical protein